jgi:oligopeptide transport system substrate-binding protein
MVINVYIATELFDFDPARHFNDDAMVKIYDLVYEGLTDLDENGKWKKALMKEYEIIGNDEDGYSMLITLNNTRWSDGRTVQAADFVYAWKRILSVDYHSEAAPLLYDVKNAYEVKQGDVSIDDVGIAAVDTYVIQVDFASKINVDNFFQKLASPALVPLREDIVDRDTYWATQTATIATNGPFAIKEINKGGLLRLERSAQYYLNPEAENQALDTYVIPYKMLNDYSVTDVIAEFEAGKLFYVAEIPLASRAEYKKEAKVTDLLATHTY